MWETDDEARQSRQCCRVVMPWSPWRTGYPAKYPGPLLAGINDAKKNFLHFPSSALNVGEKEVEPVVLGSCGRRVFCCIIYKKKATFIGTDKWTYGFQNYRKKVV